MEKAPKKNRIIIARRKQETLAITQFREMLTDRRLLRSEAQELQDMGQRWDKAMERLTQVQEPDFATTQDEAVRNILTLYMEPFMRKSFSQRMDAAMRLLAKDLLVTTMHEQDGSPTLLAREHFPGLQVNDMTYIGLAWDENLVIRLHNLAGQVSRDTSHNSDNDEEYVSKISIVDPIARFVAARRGRNNPFPMVVAPGQIAIDFNGAVTLLMPDDFEPPYGGDSDLITLFVPREIPLPLK